jgi:hypothetical protein
MNRYRMSFVQTSTLPPRMHQKLPKHGRFCKQNNQLPAKSHVELKDEINVSMKLPKTRLQKELSSRNPCYIWDLGLGIPNGW